MTNIVTQAVKTLDSQRPIDITVLHDGEIEHSCYLRVNAGPVSISIGPVAGSDLAGALANVAKEIGEALDREASPWRRDKWIKDDDK